MGIFFAHALGTGYSVVAVECNIMKDLRSSPAVAVHHRIVRAAGSKRFSTGLFPDLNKEGPTTNAIIR